MKKHENRFDVNKLFIFGAGASFAASYQGNVAERKITPLDKDFCTRLIGLDFERPAWVGQVRDELVRNFKGHRSFDSFGLEEAVIAQVGHLNFIDAIHKRKKTAYNEEKFILQMAHLISFVLRRARESKTKLYDLLAQQIIDQRNPENTNNRVITFNYDELLDSYFLDKFSPQQVYFDKILSSRTPGSRRAEVHHHPYLIKLHGSVNWRCDLAEFEQIFDNNHSTGKPYVIDSVWFSKKGDPSPDDDIVPCIIPPLPNKPITRIRLFNYLWTKAYEYLHEANELVVCGYSLPPTDNLAVSLFTNFKNSNLNKITLIDPNPTIFTRWKDLFQRKGMSSIKFEYALSLEEYLGL